MSEKYTILFVCTGNTCRSPMAEGALRVLLDKERPGKFEVVSAGTAAASGFPATHYAIEAARLWDADISEHESQPLTPGLIQSAHLILAMTPRHLDEILRLDSSAKAKAFLLKSFPEQEEDGEGVDDPIGQTLDRYNATFLEIGEYLGQHLGEIVKRIDEHTDGDK